MMKESEQSVHLVSFHTGIAGDRLLGPYFLPPHLTGAVYHDFLSNILPELLQDVDLQTRIHLWFMLDSDQAHFLLAVREFLNVFPAALPDCSPYLSPLDFYFWGHLKYTVCPTEVNGLQDLQ
jgi:hypothetical protein